MNSQSQYRNQASNSADAPQPYGGTESMQDSGRFTQGEQQQQQQGKWSTDSAGRGGGEDQYGSFNTSSDTNPPDTQRGDISIGHRVGEYPREGDQPGGGGPTQSTAQQTYTPSSYDKGQSTAEEDTQRTSTGTGAQYGQSDSKVDPSTQVGSGQGDTTGAAGGGTAASGHGPKGVKNIISGVQGAGEAIRGKVMQGVDEVFGDQTGVEKNREIAEAGMEKMRGFKGQGTASSTGGYEGAQGTAPGGGENGDYQGAKQTEGIGEKRY